MAIPNIPPNSYHQWTTDEIRDVVKDELSKVPAPPPSSGFANYSVKDWITLIAAVGSMLGVAGFGTVGHLNQTAIQTKVDAVQQTQTMADKKADDVKDALIVATDAQKKTAKATADSIGDNLKLWAERSDANAKESGDAEDKRIADEAKKAYQSHIERQKNNH